MEDCSAYIEEWKGALVTWSAAHLKGTIVPDATAEFLAEVGMPTGEDWTLEFAPTPAPSADRLIIGYDDEFPIFISQDGSIWCEDPSAVRPMNSDVQKLAWCLTLYRRYRRQARSVDEDQAAALAQLTSKGFETCDPTAFEKVGSYWSLIAEQMIHGLL